MNPLLEIIDQGGVIMIPLIILSVLLYERCLNLLLTLFQTRRRLSSEAPRSLDEIRAIKAHIEETHSQQRLIIGALISSAPLLGLLGTVIGMVTTFESLATRSGQRSVEGLADGISMALVTTETGLAIAIPAFIISYHAHRQLQLGIQKLTDLEGAFMGT